MRDLADDLRDYVDALVDAPVATPASPKRRLWLPLTVALAVAAAAVAFVMVRPTPRPTPTVATAERDGLRLTLRMLPRRANGTLAVETTVENVGPAPILLAGSSVSAPCQPFAVHVEAVRVAWAAAPQSVGGDARGIPFIDTSLPTDKPNAIYNCPIPSVFGHPLAPGERATRTFTWAPPGGWPGGAHEVGAVAARGSEYRPDPDPLTVRLPFTIHTAVSRQIGPAEALDRLARDPAYLAEITAHGGLMGVAAHWTASGWDIGTQYDGYVAANWFVDNGGAVTRRT